MKKNLPVYDEEITFEEELISTTDLKGAITSFNKAFQEVSGLGSIPFLRTVLKH